MIKYSTSDFKSGLKLIINGQPCSIIEHEFVKPGKGQAFTRVKFRNLKTGQVLDKTFKSGETVEAADVAEMKMQYLYNDPAGYYFMDTENYEQITLTEAQLGSSAHYLLPESVIAVTFFNSNPVGVELPQSMEFKVIEAEPGMRTATASASYKTAKIETGHAIKVPQFVNVGDVIRVNTSTDEYLDRVKK